MMETRTLMKVTSIAKLIGYSEGLIIGPCDQRVFMLMLLLFLN